MGQWCSSIHVRASATACAHTFVSRHMGRRLFASLYRTLYFWADNKAAYAAATTQDQPALQVQRVAVYRIACMPCVRQLVRVHGLQRCCASLALADPQGYGFDAAAAAAVADGKRAPAMRTWSLAFAEPLLAVAAKDHKEPTHSSVKVRGAPCMWRCAYGSEGECVHPRACKPRCTAHRRVPLACTPEQGGSHACGASLVRRCWVTAASSSAT